MTPTHLLPQTPLLFNGTPISILEDAKLLVEETRKKYDSLVHTVSPATATFNNVIRPLAQAENNFRSKARILKFYNDVSPDPQVRNASTKAQTLLEEFEIETRMREDLYQLVSSVAKSPNEKIDDEDRFYLDKLHGGYVRDGLNLPAGEKERFQEIKKKLSALCMQFRRNMAEDTETYGFWRSELEGLPEDFIAGLKKDISGFPRTYLVKLNHSNQGIIMESAKKPETRKRMFLAMQNRCPENVGIFKEVMLLRDEAARILGYPNHATWRLEAKMAKDPKAINEFLAELERKLVPFGREELEEIKKVKKADIETNRDLFDGHLFSWDYRHYQRALMRDKHSIDKKAIEEYFPLEITVGKMLSIFERLFGMKFVEMTGSELGDTVTRKDMIWHDDVQMFSVWDTETSESEFLGYLYLDIFFREGKYQNPSSNGFSPGFTREDGSRQYPSTAFLCSFDKSSSSNPSCVGHFELTVSLFHELGHAIHDLVAKTKYARYHGTMTVIDFGEAPSQMLEHWCWQPSVLKELSHHYSYISAEYLETWEKQADEKPQPPKQLTDDVLEKLIASKNATNSNMWLMSLFYSIFDMKVHQPESHEALQKMDISAEHNRIRKRILGRDGPEVLGEGYGWGHGEATFGHLMGDYDAGFYGYLYSKVFADDMFHSVFEGDFMNAEKGRRYRHAVLEKGGRQDEMKTLVDFLGREPNTEAFYKELGLS